MGDTAQRSEAATKGAPTAMSASRPQRQAARGQGCPRSESLKDALRTVIESDLQSGIRERLDFINLHVRPGKSLPNGLLDSANFFRPQKPARDAAFDGVEQFQPVLEQRFSQRFPLIEAFFSHEELPSVAHVPRIHFAFYAFFGPAFPTDFRFPHGLLREFHAGDGQGGDTFAASKKPQMLVGGRFDSHAIQMDPQSERDILFHRRDKRRDLGLLSDDRGIDVHDLAIPQADLTRDFLKENPAGCALPARIGIGEKMANVRLAQRSQHRVANGVQHDVCVRMSVQPARVRNLHAAQEKFAAFREAMDVVSDANVVHERSIVFSPPSTSE
jgi:hypothetical protein